MNYSKIQKFDIANGEGIRITLFVSGCRRHCPGCFNPEQQNFKCGSLLTREVIDEILTLCLLDVISGLTLLGGEPFEPENVCGLVEVAQEFKQKCPTKTIWAYSGFTFEELIARDDAKQLLEYVDILVDGPFIEAEKDLTLVFRGSRNQRIIDVKRSMEEKSVVISEEFVDEKLL